MSGPGEQEVRRLVRALSARLAEAALARREAGATAAQSSRAWARIAASMLVEARTEADAREEAARRGAIARAGWAEPPVALACPCGAGHHARGLCGACYQRARRRGRFPAGARLEAP